jgi:cephalosporin hydroxylase
MSFCIASLLETGAAAWKPQLNGTRGRVISIDVDPSANLVHGHPGIDFLIGDSGSLAVADAVRRRLPPDCGPLFAILDSDHAKAHVLRELNAFVPLLRKGDYLVVEDTCVNGRPVRPEFGPGPDEALQEFLAAKSNGFRAGPRSRSEVWHYLRSCRLPPEDLKAIPAARDCCSSAGRAS